MDTHTKVPRAGIGPVKGKLHKSRSRMLPLVRDKLSACNGFSMFGSTNIMSSQQDQLIL